MSDTPQSMGGKARKAALTSSERSTIAREAANSRWGLPKATSGDIEKYIRIADFRIPCFVLDDGRRVISTNGMLDALTLARGGSMKAGMSRLELFVSGKLISKYVSDELLERVKVPVKFLAGTNVTYGYDSDTLIDIAEAIGRAADAGVLQSQQAAIAFQCKVITSSLTRIGLIALIDEATGYQTKRDADELQKILSAYLLPEHRPWMKTIPQNFTDEIYRVYGWTRSTNNRGPRYAGKLIRQLIYAQMPKPILPALDQANPANEKYQRKHKHHQFLTEQQGLDHFRSLVITVMTLLRISKNKGEFKRHWSAYFNGQTELDV